MQLHKQEANKTKEDDGVQQSQRHVQHPNPTAASPPSSTSPSHEFSFTISLRSPPPPGKNKSPPLTAVDLSPADEIFFHGHLLPLHLLSHLPVSPRPSTNSTDNFTLPIKDSSQSNTQTAPNNRTITYPEKSILQGNKVPRKSKSFSLFGLPKQRTECEKGENKFQEGQNGKSKFRFLQRYIGLIKPFVISLWNRRENPQIHRQNYSFSGNLKLRSKLKGLRGRREFSAPASMWNSPTNSGPLMASGNITPTNNNNKSDSTMEELQAAIQAAIAHCKKSVDGGEDKNKQP
ncbi:hypothetical protein CASFOL_021282 [Castilleja foliolosa]|uniref:BRI1 kinase inhibitor 1 n=1 Tax=Castilleja foliolosa TaxID=1961234 RepID=A0ABD3CW36_9LAMI